MAPKVITLSICLLLCFVLTQCQRPSYAGSRPPLGNKDKYRPTQSPESIELANRFGGDTLPNGATQRPPQGIPVINAEQVFVPITSNQIQPSGINQSNGTSTQGLQMTAQTSGNASSGVMNVPSRLPLDAHGDQQLIDHLNHIPIDNRPFWYINYQAIEAQRNGSVSNFGPIASRGSFFGK